MAESTQFMFSHQDVVTELLKSQGIHEGIWMLVINFGFGAAAVGQSEGSSELNPTAIIPVLRIGIQLTDQLNSLSVDAAKVNPTS